jgi:hypothetical protein
MYTVGDLDAAGQSEGGPWRRHCRGGSAVRLLVVEDTPKMAALLQRAFREDGYAVDVQASGSGAAYSRDLLIGVVRLPEREGIADPVP